MGHSNQIAEEFDEVLKDVRSSYRFLYQYQKRLMDLTTFIGNHWDFQFDTGESIFSGPPKTWKNIDPGKHWAWDFLLLYNYNFVYSSKTLGEWERVRLMINTVSDTGFYDSQGQVKTRIQDFASVEESKTQLHIILKTQGIDWRNYTDKQFTALSENDGFAQNENKDQLLIGKKYDLSRFIDEEKTLLVLKDFEDFCKLNGVGLVSDQGKEELSSINK